MIIGFTGFAQVGKDTAANFLVERGFKRIAFADILRQSLYNLNPYVVLEERFDYVDGVMRKPELVRVRNLVDKMGWDSVKVVYPEIRELLQRMGTEVGRDLYGENFWVNMAMKGIRTHYSEDDSGGWGVLEVVGDYVITDVRFPNEEQAVHKRNGRIFRIERPGTDAVNSHISDTGIASLAVDGVIENTGDLDQYRAAVLEAVGLD